MRPGKSKSKVCVVCSAGGHLSEAIEALVETGEPKYFITFGEPHARMRLKDEEAYFIVDPHTSLLKYLLNFIQSLALYAWKRPKIIFSTGSGIALATCILGKLFRSKIIYLETGARINTPSRTGKFMYRLADVFIVQWKPLLEYYPEARYVGPLI